MSARYEPYPAPKRVRQPMHPAQVAALFIMGISLILFGFATVPYIMAVFLPPPFEYVGLPFQVTVAQVKAGEAVPFLVTRCAHEPLDNDGRVAYTVSRTLVRVDGSARHQLPILPTSVESQGCSTVETLAHQIPPGQPPGVYYLEGVATVYGRWRLVNAYFYTTPFEVVAP